MISRLRLANFKAFSESVTIPLKPLTLIYGTNSSGKSSVLQALLLLQQTLSEAERPDVLLLPKGRLVDLGGYRDLIHRHNLGSDLRIELSTELALAKHRPMDLFVGPTVSPGKVSLAATFRYAETQQSAVLVKLEFFAGDHPDVFAELRPESSTTTGASSTRMTMRVPNPKHPFWEQILREFLRPQRDRAVARLSMPRGVDLATRRTTLGPSARPPSPTDRERDRLARRTDRWLIHDITTAAKNVVVERRNFLPLQSRVHSTHYDSILRASGSLWDPAHLCDSIIGDLVAAVGQLLSAELSRFVYIGPLRDFPERHYIYSGNPSSSVGKTGQMTPDILFKDPQLVVRINKSLDAFGMPYQLLPQSNVVPEELEGVFALRLVEEQIAGSVSLADVGFGVSQMLPIIVQCQLSEGSTIVIEQPEIHLHPKLQAELGSLFVQSIRERHNSLVVETHSEHMLLRIRKLIRLGHVSADDVCVLFVHRYEGSSRLTEMRLDDSGRFLDQWPAGFFEEELAELFDQ